MDRMSETVCEHTQSLTQPCHPAPPQVRQGDYVSKIAATFQVSIESVLHANGPEDIPNPELFLQPGIKLRVCNPNNAGTSNVTSKASRGE